MNLIEKDIKVKDIMLDNLNPRFGKKMNYTQCELILYLQKGDKSKELLTSMMSELSWVNKIVIVPIAYLSDEEIKIYKLYNKNFMSEYKYIVVEGNTRVACLHHDSMRDIFNINGVIPVILVERSKGESDKKFLQSRKRLQSISNVMVVKEWGDIPKAKQLFDSYKLIQEINPEKSGKDIFKELADTLGLQPSLVKKFVYRYAFYRELIENVEFIEEKDFKFLEVFEQNNTIKGLFGLDYKTLAFEWDITDKDDENAMEVIEKKQELLYMFPKIMDIAKGERINSKLLRDIIRKYHSDGLEELHQKFRDILDYSETEEYSNDSFLKLFPREDYIENEEKKIKNNINNILTTLKSFPVNQDFSQNFKEDIGKIRDISSKILKMMDI